MTAVPAKAKSNNTRLLNSRVLLFPGFLVILAIAFACLVWSITLGAANINYETIYEALTDTTTEEFNHLVIRTVRFPRVLAGMIAGAGLATAGAIMQGLTRNPLGDSSILGINAGASFAVVLCVYLARHLPLSAYAPAAMTGAALAAIIVYGLGSMGRGGATPLRLTLAGVILTAFVTALTTAMLIQDQKTLEQIRFWTSGSLAGREMPIVQQTAPFILIGVLGAFLLGRQITLMSMGEDIAKGLGQNTGWIKILAAIIVVLTAGGAVALAGPIGFVGLIVPHIARFMVGVDYRWILPYSAMMGAILVTVADIGARLVIRPQELPVGIMMAIIGAPFFVYLARWKVQR